MSAPRYALRTRRRDRIVLVVTLLIIGALVGGLAALLNGIVAALTGGAS